MGNCNFEDDTCGYLHSRAGDFNFVRQKGADGINNNGPLNDHTTESNQGSYMYAEAAGKASGAVAALSSPWVNFISSCTVRFAYYLYGSNSGSLWLNLTTVYDTNSVNITRIHLRVLTSISSRSNRPLSDLEQHPL